MSKQRTSKFVTKILKPNNVIVFFLCELYPFPVWLDAELQHELCFVTVLQHELGVAELQHDFEIVTSLVRYCCRATT